MVQAEQVKNLVQAHYENDRERFNAIALQVALELGKKKNVDTAAEISNMLEKAANDIIPGQKPIDLSAFIIMFHPNKEYDELLFSQKVLDFIEGILTMYKEQEQRNVLGFKAYYRRFLLAGKAENGQMETASVIAQELELPLYVVRIYKILKQPSANITRLLQQLFEMMRTHKGVYVLKGFDEIENNSFIKKVSYFPPSTKDNQNEEQRVEYTYIRNSFIKYMEYDKSESLIFCETDSKYRLTPELFLLFHDSIEYESPGKEIIEEIIKLKLGAYLEDFPLTSAVRKATYFTHDKIRYSCCEAIQRMVLNNNNSIDKANLHKAFFGYY